VCRNQARHGCADVLRTCGGSSMEPTRIGIDAFVGIDYPKEWKNAPRNCE
jgi:hypothetical protein